MIVNVIGIFAIQFPGNGRTSAKTDYFDLNNGEELLRELER
jgi:hypothetical protein